jgi:RNA polymerase sigma-70 factor (ECF subfamily)
MHSAAADSAETERLLNRIRAGEREAVDRLLEAHRSYLHKFVDVRLDPKLRPRLDASDVIQDAEMEALRRLESYLDHPVMPFRLWLRQLAYDRVLMARRQHIKASRRAVHREARLPERSSLLLAQRLFAAGPSPSQQILRRELADRVRRGVGQLPEAEREILIMRKLEGLSNQEVAQVLQVDPATASRRFGRAVIRLHEILQRTGLGGSES